MRFTSGSPGYYAPVRWYFCAPTAKPLDIPTVFCSANWDSNRFGGRPLGEDWQFPRKWVDGSPPPWVPPDHGCDFLTGNLPDTLYAVITHAAEVDPPADVFTSGSVIALPRASTHPNAWGGTWGLDPITSGGLGVTFLFGCLTIAFFPWPSIFVISYTLALPDVLEGAFDGTHYLGAAGVWLRGTENLEEPLYEVVIGGECPQCGISEWYAVNGIDFASALSDGIYSQPCSVVISGVNPIIPDAWHSFAPWFWPNGYLPPGWF